MSYVTTLNLGTASLPRVSEKLLKDAEKILGNKCSGWEKNLAMELENFETCGSCGIYGQRDDDHTFDQIFLNNLTEEGDSGIIQFLSIIRDCDAGFSRSIPRFYYHGIYSFVLCLGRVPLASISFSPDSGCVMIKNIQATDSRYEEELRNFKWQKALYDIVRYWAHTNHVQNVRTIHDQAANLILPHSAELSNELENFLTNERPLNLDVPKFLSGFRRKYDRPKSWFKRLDPLKDEKIDLEDYDVVYDSHRSFPTVTAEGDFLESKGYGLNYGNLYYDAFYVMVLRYRKQPVAVIGFDPDKDSIHIRQIQGIKYKGGKFVKHFRWGLALIGLVCCFACKNDIPEVRIQPAGYNRWEKIAGKPTKPKYVFFGELMVDEEKKRRGFLTYDVNARKAGFERHTYMYYDAFEKYYYRADPRKVSLIRGFI